MALVGEGVKLSSIVQYGRRVRYWPIPPRRWLTVQPSGLVLLAHPRFLGVECRRDGGSHRCPDLLRPFLLQTD
jgi:hypothetical protein